MNEESDHHVGQCRLRIEAEVPIERIVAMAKEAHRHGMDVQDYILQKIALLLSRNFNPTSLEISVTPRPVVVTKTAKDYAELCAIGTACHPTSGFAEFARGKGVKKAPKDPDTFEVIVDR